ncbi:MAG: response regulator [Magnetococcales bacterium]|nr:response regulator [Magnetococcales bacterium]
MNAWFLQPGEDIGTAMAGFYEPHLVLLSLLAVYLGSFAGLAVIRPLTGDGGSWPRRIWLAFGIIAFGCGVFTMHFLGMLAFRLPVAVSFDLVTTLASSIPGFLSAWWMLRLAGRHDQEARGQWLGGVVVGAGIGVMHYAGMMAMRLEAVMRFDPAWFWSSIALVVLLTVPAIRVRALVVRLGWDPDNGLGRHVAPLIMAAVIAGMHYTAMGATRFLPGLCETDGGGWRIDPLVLGLGLAIVMFVLIVSYLFAVYLGQRERDYPDTFLLVLRMWARDNRKIFYKSLAVVLGVFLLFAWTSVVVHEFTDYFLHQNDRTEERNRVVKGPEDDILNRPIAFMLLLGGLLMSLAIAWIVALFLVARRLSEQAEAEARRELEFQKRALDEHAIVSTTDIRGNIIYVNENFVAISGYSREELLGQNHRLVKSNEHGPEFYRQMWRTITSGRSWHGEVKNQARDGSYYWVRATIVPMLDELQKPFQYVSIRTDITAMKDLESSLRVAKEQAVAAARAKSDFLANMSHEIRTPMNAIIGLSHLCLQTQLTTRQKDYLRKVHNSATSLLRIINDILDFSKIEAGRLAMETIDFTLEEVLGNLASMISLKAQEKRLEFLMETAPNIPPMLRGDPLRLGQILVNLANNAIKFTDQGEVAVVTELLDKDESLLCLQFTVRDTGIGMTEAQRNGLFRAFSQADTSITRKYGGTGLGLTIAKRLIEMMAGSIRVESEPGMGTRFIFTVCLGYVPQEVEKSLLPAVDLRGLKALVVDDNESARNVIADYLASFTFRVSKANGAAEAIIAVQEAEMVGVPFDLVVMDYMMPVMDGITVTTRMRRELGLTRQPVVIMATAYGEEQVVRRAVEEAEVNGFLVKPISQNLLFEAVMEAFGRSAGGSRESGANLAGERDFMAVLSGARILLVEDNEINQQVARELLEQANITVLLAVNGQEAVAMVEREILDGVLMDMQMPVMDGLTATRRIRMDARFVSLPIIAMTANAMAGDRELCLEAGMQDHIAKPVEPRAMFATMARWIKPAAPAPLPQRTAESDKQESGETLPDLPGLDARDGLRRMGGNVRGYLNLLAKFRANQGEAESAIRQALTAADMATAERLAHTLKGVGASIGARELADMALVLEKAIRAGEDPARLEALLKAAGRSLAELCAMLDVALVRPQPEPARGVVEETGDLLARRKELLRLAGEQLQIYDAAIEKTLAELRATFSANHAPEWLMEMERLVGRYDFETAMGILRSQEVQHA